MSYRTGPALSNNIVSPTVPIAAFALVLPAASFLAAWQTVSVRWLQLRQPRPLPTTLQLLPFTARARIWYEPQDELWSLGKITKHTTTANGYTVRFMYNPGPIQLTLTRRRSNVRRLWTALTTSWRFQVNKESSIAYEVSAMPMAVVQRLRPSFHLHLRWLAAIFVLAVVVLFFFFVFYVLLSVFFCYVLGSYS